MLEVIRTKMSFMFERVDLGRLKMSRGGSGIESAEMEENGSGIPLWEEERDRHDGTGETRQTLSWIWTTKS